MQLNTWKSCWISEGYQTLALLILQLLGKLNQVLNFWSESECTLTNNLKFCTIFKNSFMVFLKYLYNICNYLHCFRSYSASCNFFYHKWEGDHSSSYLIVVFIQCCEKDLRDANERHYLRKLISEMVYKLNSQFSLQ